MQSQTSNNNPSLSQFPTTVPGNHFALNGHGQGHGHGYSTKNNGGPTPATASTRPSGHPNTNGNGNENGYSHHIASQSHLTGAPQQQPYSISSYPQHLEYANMNVNTNNNANNAQASGSGQGQNQGQAGPSAGPSSVGVGGSSDALKMEDTEGEDVDGSGLKRKNSHGDDGTARVQLACFFCRSKRIRCSGEKPVCSACQKANVNCEWPSGRRKKRTRKEMEEAKRLEAEAMVAVGGSGQYPGHTQSDQQPSFLQQQPQQQQMQQQPQQQQQQQHQQHQQQQQMQQPLLHQQSQPRPLQPPPNRDLQQNNPQNQAQTQPSNQGQSQNLNQSQNQNQNQNNISMDMAFNLPMMGMSTGFTPNMSMFDGDDKSFSADLSTNFDPIDFWSFPPAGSSTGPGTSANADIGGNYVWPTGFTPEGGNAVVPSDPLEPTMRQFMTSPATDVRLMNALENQAAFIQGNPGEDEDLELYYYRFSGSTAIQPGIHRISLKLQRRDTGESPMTAAPQSETDEQQIKIPTPSRGPNIELFDASGMPHMTVWEPLFELFLVNMSQHFPSVSRMRMGERFETGTMSQFLASCICACGARFASDAKDRQTQACAPFIAKAQELLVPLVHLPTTEATTGLLMLAWANYGQNSESGLWQYSGMSIRMGIDIGIHENSEVYESPAHVIRTRHLFWTLFITDRVVAFATGRPASIPEDIIEIPLPEDKDFFPDPARNMPGYPTEQVEPVPFVYFVRLMIICGRISNVLNGRRGRARTLVNSAEPLAEQLAELQMKLVQFVANLPATLKWSADNFKHQHGRGHGGTFLSLHLWAHAVLALIYHPELLKSPSGVETPLNRGMNRNIKLSLASSRQICECMVFADLVAPSSYTSTPFIVQPLFVASMAIIHEMRAVQAAESTGNPTDVFLLSMARQNLSALMSAIGTMEQYWAGTSYVAQILEKRSGFKASSRTGRKTFISLPDTGLLRRFTTDKDHPKDVAPATQTSLRESIAKSERQKSSPFWLSDLMAGYTVENMSFAPADSFDIERLLGGAGMGLMGPPQQQGQQQQGQGQRQGPGQGQDGQMGMQGGQMQR